MEPTGVEPVVGGVSPLASVRHGPGELLLFDFLLKVRNITLRTPFTGIQFALF